MDSRPDYLRPVDEAIDAAEMHLATDGGGGRRRVPDGTLPDDVPILCLGKHGNLYYLIDSTKQLRVFKYSELQRAGIYSIFDLCLGLLEKHWPRKKMIKDAEGNIHYEVTGIKFEKVTEAIMAECARGGIWDPINGVRGRGAWRGEHGQLILHCGNTIWVGAVPGGGGDPGYHTTMAPGRIDRHVYPAAPPVPMPAREPAAAGPDGPAATLLQALETWKWRRGATDAHLLLGWIGAAMLAGALKWRPMMWITGDSRTGKSTVHELLGLVFDDAILAVTDTSAAGIWQKVGHASLPVAVDELEADADNRKAAGVITLARHAASGGMTLRGGADHTATEFTARNCFLFSSILVPPLKSQDLNRQTILHLDTLDSTTPPALTPSKWRCVGAELRRRLCDGWHRWEPTLEAYREQLLSTGHDGRSADQWGTLLAAADLLLTDHAPDGDTLGEWAAKLSVAGTRHHDDRADHDRCLEHLRTTRFDGYRSGIKRPIGGWIAEAAGRDGETALAPDPVEANRILSTIGLKVVREADRAGVETKYLAVANAHQGLAELFAGTHWGGASGASGVWRQALERVEGYKLRKSPLSFDGSSARCILVPVAEVLGDEPDDQPES